MGHLITSEVLKPDPTKVNAVAKMAKPTDVKSIQRLIGFVTYLSWFLRDLFDRIEPSRQLAKINQAVEIFEDVKCLVISSPVLAYYNPEEDLVIGYQFMFRARMCRSLIFDRVGDWDQRTVHSCAKHKLIT